MHGDYEILESSTGKTVFLTRRLALASDEQVRLFQPLTLRKRLSLMPCLTLEIVMPFAPLFWNRPVVNTLANNYVTT